MYITFAPIYVNTRNCSSSAPISNGGIGGTPISNGGIGSKSDSGPVSKSL